LPALLPASAKVSSTHACCVCDRVTAGVRIKGTRLARMQDGIFDTDVADMFRVHSTSGQAEW
jgi:hypothetical protein